MFIGAGSNVEAEIDLITELLEKVGPSHDNTIAITCGPPIMIYYVDKTLQSLGFKPEQSYVTLEARMHCGIGKCGHCMIGKYYVCKDGPVFTYEQIRDYRDIWD